MIRPGAPSKLGLGGIHRTLRRRVPHPSSAWVETSNLIRSSARGAPSKLCLGGRHRTSAGCPIQALLGWETSNPPPGASPSRLCSGGRPIPHAFFRASFCSRPVQNKKLSSSHFDSHINPSTSRVRKLSAGFPEYVSTLHFRNSLRHGRSRCPRVAFQINLIAPNKSAPP